MTGLLNIVKALLWVLDYVRKNPKKSAVAGVGAGAMAFYAGAGVPTGPYFWPSGTPTEGYVVTADANGQPAWEENAGGGGGGGGDPIYTPDGLTEVTQVTSFDPTLYGANPNPNQATLTGTENSGSTAIDLTAGHGAFFREGQDVVIPRAGAAHQWAAITPSIGGVGRGGQAVITCSTTTDEITIVPWDGAANFQATSANAANGQAVVFYTEGANLMAVGGTPLVQGTTYYLGAGTTLNSYKVFTSQANAIAGTPALNFDGAGDADISMSFTGTTTMAYYLAGDSGNMGLTVASSAPSFTTSSATLNAFSYNVIWWDRVVDGGGNEVNGYHIWASRDGSTEHYLTGVNRVQNGIKVTCQAGGYVDFVPTDVGKRVLAGSFRGYLEWYDNATRTLIISQDRAGSYVFPAAATIALYRTDLNGNTTECGVGSGTVTGTSTLCYYLRDYGDVAWGDYKPAVWRTGVEKQQLQISGTPSGGTYVVALYGQEQFVAYNVSSENLQVALRKLPRCGGVTVTTAAGSVPDITHEISFYGGASADEGMGDVPEIEVRSYMTGGSPVMTVATTVPGAHANPGDFILEPPDSTGVWYECIQSPGFHANGPTEPTWDTDLNDITSTGHGQTYRRVNRSLPVTRPTSATADAHYARISSKSSDQITIDDATDTTVSAGTPVFPNSLPGLQRTWDAIIANKGGTIDLPPGFFQLYSGTRDKAEWIGQISSGNYCLFETMQASGTHRLPLSMGFRGRDATIAWRLSEVECYPDAFQTGSTLDPSGRFYGTGAQSFINFNSNDSFVWDVKSFYVSTTGEPRGNAYNSEHSLAMFSASMGGGDYETSERVRISNAEILGLPNGLGVFDSSGYGPNIRHTVEGSTVQYGGCGHDSGANGGTWINSTIEGTNTQYRSTAIYTNAAVSDGFEAVNLKVLEPGQDGMRLRCGSVLWQGGEIFISSARGTSNPFLIEDTCKGFLIANVEMTGGLQIASISAPGKFHNCTTRNTVFNVLSTNVELSDNKGYCTNGVRSNQAPVWITVNGVADVTLSDNVLQGTNLTTGSSDRVNMYGLQLTGAGCTRIKTTGNKLNGTGVGLSLASSFVGTLDSTGDEFRGFDPGGSGWSNDLSAGNGAVCRFTGGKFGTLSSTTIKETRLAGTSSATYHFFGTTFENEVEVAAALTGDVRFEMAKFIGSDSVDFLDAGTKLIDCEFAVAPTLTGATLFTRGNTVAGLSYTAVALAGNQDNYVWPVTDTVIFTTTGSNDYSITGVVARAPGSIINIVNADTTPNTLTITHDATSTATNQFNINAGASLVLGQGDGASFISTGSATTGWSEN